ncbi:YceI family protein [Ruegeria marina]|uniref:Polyisoprenoid-binding protein YceI n=1 Tax=Ruegeria marina TaxID=639004 RepID=A0A1G6QET0_9RHOB|nr:YceI family protein [Ruegeria marina]SDC90175.1 Polyisoprenoid-binding protein YceI [Ruegeria marina]
MPLLNRRDMLAAALLLSMLRPVAAAPVRYVLDQNRSEVGFSFDLAGTRLRGTMPVAHAEVLVDFSNLSRSSVDVTLDVAKARVSLPLARRTMLGPDILWAERFPEIRFVSARIRLGPDGRISDGAEIVGHMTIRDTTRPVTLRAALYRQPGSAPEDLDLLNIRLTGSISRRAFGASGRADIVRDRVNLDISATVRRAE